MLETVDQPAHRARWFVAAAALAVAGLVAFAGLQRPSTVMFGFTRDHAAAESAVERRFLSLQNPARIRDEHAVLTSEPHVAGSARDYELMVRMRGAFAAAGLESVEVSTHEVLLPWPQEVVVEMSAPVPWSATMREEGAGIPYHAYSASGEVTAPVVDAGGGDAGDYARLHQNGIDVRGRIVLVRSSVPGTPYSYRGAKVYTAEQHGAAAILLYSDRALEWGGIAYDFIVPGDPLTPGWASVPGARRIDPAGASSLPRIISVPISATDARTIREAPSAVLHVRVRIDREIRPVWTLTGMIRGSDGSDDVVIVGNHRDAWVYGGADPSSGTAALIELARTLGELTRSGWRPRRSILFASWDAEEFALTSSTEWGEQHAERLSRSAIAYINVDSAASGPRFTATAVPALNRTIAEAAQAVRDPNGASIAAATRDRRARDAGQVSDGSARLFVDTQVGSGSDYAVFLNHLGIPIADLSFTGPFDVYHTVHDTHAWVSRIADPGFRYHSALVQLWGILAMRLADADAVPLDYEEYAARIRGFVADVARQADASPSRTAALADVTLAAERMQRAAASYGRTRDDALARNDAAALEVLNRKVLRVERALLSEDGLQGRPWYRHLVYAPRFTYAPEVLPGISEAIEADDAARLTGEARRLAAALNRAAAALD